jgi:hypothetical protein
MARWKNRMAVSNSRCIRQRSSAHVSIRQQLYGAVEEPYGRFKLALHTPAFGSTRQHTSATVWRGGRTVWPFQTRAAYVSIRQHSSAYVSIRQHTSATIWPFKTRAACRTSQNRIRTSVALLRLYQKALSRLYQGSIKAL